MEIKKIDLYPISDKNIKSGKNIFKKKKLWLFFLVFFVVVLVAVVIPGLLVINQAKLVYSQAMGLKDAAKTKDLKIISDKINLTQNSLVSLNQSLNLLIVLKPIPFLGSYVDDSEHMVRAGKAGLEAAQMVVKSIEPYADIIGFAGGTNVQTGQKTAQDRITLIATTLDKIRPDLEQIGEKIKVVKSEVDQVNPNRYPVELSGKKIREPLTGLIGLVDQASLLINDAKPVIEVSPWLLGMDSVRRYLIILQNDAELRPTGGFMTAYAIIEVDKGKLKPILSEDIYDLDARFPSKDKAPQALIDYLPFPYKSDPHWRLRDMNISPDFQVSMEMFTKNFKIASPQKFDGVIAVDTQVLVKLLKVTGPIGVSGWGNFSAEPDTRCFGCPQVVYELESLADKPTNKVVVARKAVIGPLMHSVLANAFGLPKEKIPGLFDAVFSSVTEKRVLFYFPDANIQKAVASFNMTGNIKPFDGDYFHLNDTSFSGAKSNLFIKQEVEQKIDVASDGSVTKTVTVIYKNPYPASDCNLERGGLCLNAPYKDWFRLYVPKGSELIESTGSDVEIKTYEEFGKTVFEGFFGNNNPLRPQGQTKLTFKYKLPFKAGKEYPLMIQKQPGTEGALYTITVGNHKEEFTLTTDKTLKINR